MNRRVVQVLAALLMTATAWISYLASKPMPIFGAISLSALAVALIMDASHE